MGSGAPIFGSPSFVASDDDSTVPWAPVSITNGNGPAPLMQTLASAATWDCRVLTVTGNLVPPRVSRLAPVQPCPAGGSANCTTPFVLAGPLPPVAPGPAQEATATMAAMTAPPVASRRAGRRPAGRCRAGRGRALPGRCKLIGSPQCGPFGIGTGTPGPVNSVLVSAVRKGRPEPAKA